MQDHEKWIRESFSTERVPLDTHALFQNLQSELPKKKNRRGFTWLWALPFLFFIAYSIFAVNQSPENTEHHQIADGQSSILENNSEIDFGSSPKAELEASSNTKSDKTLRNAKNSQSDKSINPKNSTTIAEGNVIELSRSIEGITTANTNETLAKDQPVSNKNSASDLNQKDSTVKKHDEHNIIPSKPFTVSQTATGPRVKTTDKESSSGQLAEGKFPKSYESMGTSPRKQYLSSSLASQSMNYLIWRNEGTAPIIRTNATAQRFLSFWAQASTSTTMVKHNTGNQITDELYQNSAQAKPGFQIDLGTNINLNSYLRLRTSVFYRSLVQSIQHNYVIRTASEQEGIKQLVIDNQGNTNPNNGAIEVVELRQYKGIWYNFLNQTGINVALAYSQNITPRSNLELGLGLSTSLFSQNTGSFITEELAINPIENNSYLWKPTMSFQPSLGYAYTINRELKAGIQLQYFNTQTLFSNQQFRYHVFNIGLTCSYKL